MAFSCLSFTRFVMPMQKISMPESFVMFASFVVTAASTFASPSVIMMMRWGTLERDP